jgi:hypothetical protein
MVRGWEKVRMLDVQMCGWKNVRMGVFADGERRKRKSERWNGKKVKPDIF